MPLVRKSFAEFFAEVTAGLAAGRENEPIAETTQLRIVEHAPGDWRLVMVFDHAVEVVSNESFPTFEEAVEVVTDRLESCIDPGQICRIQ
jgi:hypothetical protein